MYRIIKLSVSKGLNIRYGLYIDYLLDFHMRYCKDISSYVIYVFKN
jgi:hypothetical protein